MTCLCRKISLRQTLAAGGIAFGVLTSPLVADELAPNVPLVVNLGEVSGVVSYSSDAGAFHVYATLEGDGRRPLHLETTLSSGQSLTISAPRGTGRTSDTLKIARVQDRIFALGPVKGQQPIEALAMAVFYTVGR